MSSDEILQVLVELSQKVGTLNGDMITLTTKMEDSFRSLEGRMAAVENRLEVVERSNDRLDDNIAGIGVTMTHLGYEVRHDIRTFKTVVGQSLIDVEDDQVLLEKTVVSFASKDYVDRQYQMLKDMVSHEQSRV
jgi:hypothetical protein